MRLFDSLTQQRFISELPREFRTVKCLNRVTLIFFQGLRQLVTDRAIHTIAISLVSGESD
jgi:hypothetical protein